MSEKEENRALIAQMKFGYAEMGQINREWAELGVVPDAKSLERYEKTLAAKADMKKAN